jgi:hypothetical protein
VVIIDETAEVRMGNLTIRNGSGTFDPSGIDGRLLGGGIYNKGVLHLSNCVVTQNAVSLSPLDFGELGQLAIGAGIYNRGALDVEDCSIIDNHANGPGNGGGIANDGSATITRTLIAQNTAGFGAGGLLNIAGHSMTVTSSLLTGNDDGALTNNGTLQVVNCTISGNHSYGVSAGGFANNGGSASLDFTTIYNNSMDSTPGGTNAGVGNLTNDSDASVQIRNSIIANSPEGPNCADNASSGIVSLGHNLSSDDSYGLSGPSDLQSTDPLLGPLQDNDGPTLTHALLPGSPAIDAGDNADAPPTDQRGLPRLADGDGNGSVLADIGAYELQNAAPADTTPPSITGAGSGRDAQGFAYLDVRFQDTGSGLQSIEVVHLVNATAGPISFTPGTTAPVIVRFTSTSKTQGSSITVRATDVAGNVR